MSRPRKDLDWFEAVADQQLVRIQKRLGVVVARCKARRTREVKRALAMSDEVTAIGRAIGANGPCRLSLDDLEERL